ncbi:AMP-binding protein [Actinacidiphila oryziradicis]|uniref:AMP-dependent synthetase n=1 Tax=Actinacidiphila oryziradicis TaxID=2571141 RepID=A0A4U0SBZ5_9ACTN|nr:AMP-binding protein [Actinacidiphila oryziradicis]TKA04981.1 AMP-dependent synthetase [Actinacidiphila oryziradicis]
MEREPLSQSYWPAEEGGEEVRDLTLGELLREAAKATPDRLALVDGVKDPAERRSWTYTQFLDAAEHAARALLKRFSPGDRIAVWAPNSADWIILQEGISLAGMVMVAVNPAYRSQELGYILKQSRSAGLFHIDSYRDFDMRTVVDEVLPQLPDLKEAVSFSDWDAFLESGDPEQELPPVSPTDPIQVQYTSGTTGFPKGALLHHKGLVNEAHFVALRAGMSDGGVYINAMPMYHIGGGAVTSFGAVAVHGTFVIMGGFDAGLMLELFEAYKGTHTLVVPTMLMALLDHPDRESRDLSSLQTIMSGAAAVPAALVRRTIATLNCQFSILFGQTEMHGVISQTRLTDSPEDQSETVGRPLAHLEVKIADLTTNAPVPLGEKGGICCRGYQNMIGYYELPKETAETIDSEGWVHMGDMGTMDERGFIKVTGRLKDMIIRGGVNIYPREIEELLDLHPAVGYAAVIGVPDEKWGEQIAAVIRVKDGEQQPTPDELKKFCRERMAAHKSPVYWIFVDDFPVTASGKLQKFKLKEQFAAGVLEAEVAQSSAPQPG